LSAQRKQLEAMAAAQSERETALNKAEEAQRKRATMARIRNMALVAVSILALLAGWLGWRAEQQRATADHILAGATDIIVEVQDQMNDDTRKKVFKVFQTGADLGDASSMFNLGQGYANGLGVAQDYDKAREWFEKAADKGHAGAMVNLGVTYEKGNPVLPGQNANP
jgi:TPR repeat protein